LPICHIETPDLHADMSENADWFDMSNFRAEHPLCRQLPPAAEAARRLSREAAVPLARRSAAVHGGFAATANGTQ